MNKQKEKKSIYNLANFLSISRIFSSIPLIICFENMNKIDGPSSPYYYSIAIICFIVLSDILDGFFARLSNCVTDFGKIIDPVADKVCFLVVLIYMIDKNYYPNFFLNPFLVFYIILSLRDILLVLISLFNLLYKKEVSQANNLGKLFILFSSIMVISQIYYINQIVTVIFYLLSIVTMFLSTYYYIKEYAEIRNK